MVNMIRLGAVDSLTRDLPLWQRQCLEAYAKARHPLIVSDYDGTLTDIVKEPAMAAPTGELLRLLTGLAAKGATAVCSGRDAETLQTWLGKLPLALVAEHGARVRTAVPGAAFTDKVTPGALAWMPAAKAIVADLTARTPGSMFETKTTSLAWHYRNVEPGLGVAAAETLEKRLTAAMPSNVEVHPGKMVIEVRPRGVHKGGAVAELAKGHDFVLTLGDDRTDEDMFAFAGTNVWSVKVGVGETKAKHRLSAPADVRAFLALLAEAR